MKKMREQQIKIKRMVGRVSISSAGSIPIMKVAREENDSISLLEFEEQMEEMLDDAPDFNENIFCTNYLESGMLLLFRENKKHSCLLIEPNNILGYSETHFGIIPGKEKTTNLVCIIFFEKFSGVIGVNEEGDAIIFSVSKAPAEKSIFLAEEEIPSEPSVIVETTKDFSWQGTITINLERNTYSIT